MVCKTTRVCTDTVVGERGDEGQRDVERICGHEA